MEYNTSMKMTRRHFDTLAELVSPLDTPQRRDKYKARDFYRAETTTDINKRYRWDLLWAVPSAELRPLMVEVYKYADDANVDTALRRIVPDLE